MITVVSLDQFKFGILRLRNNPHSANNNTKTIEESVTQIKSAAFNPKTIDEHTASAKVQGKVITTCNAIFAFNTSRSFIGMVCIIQIFLPSSDTDGAVITLIDDMVSSAAIAISAEYDLKFSCGSNVIALILSRSIAKATVAIRVNSEPIAVFSIYDALEVKRLSSRTKSARLTLLTFILTFLREEEVFEETRVTTFIKLLDKAKYAKRHNAKVTAVTTSKGIGSPTQAMPKAYSG